MLWFLYHFHNLAQNRIRTIPSDIASLSSLTHLQVNLFEIPIFVVSQKILKTMKLLKFHLTWKISHNLSICICNSHSMKYLKNQIWNVGNNGVQTFPTELTFATLLRYLNIEGIKKEKFPQFITEFAHLKSLFDKRII